jgi:hypothetical protein
MIWFGLDFWPGTDAVFMFVGSLAAICVGAYPHTATIRTARCRLILSSVAHVQTEEGLYQRMSIPARLDGSVVNVLL